MIKSINYWAFEGGLDGAAPIESVIDQAKRAGYAGVELAIGMAGVLTPESDRATCEKYRRAMADAGLALETFACPITWAFSPSHPDAAVRAKSIALHKASIERAAWLGAKAMLFIPGAVIIPWDASYPPVPYDDAVRFAGEAIEQLLPAAEAAGVDLCVENVWNGMFYSPLELAGFIDRFKHERLGVYFDVGNVVGLHQYPQHWIKILGKRIRRVHLKDFKREVGNMTGFCELTEGSVDWPAVMNALRGIGYDRTLTAEMIPPTPGILERTSAAMDRILAM